VIGFGQELRRAAAGVRIVPRLVAEAPQEWRLGPLTVVVDADAAQLRYARVPIARARPAPADIMTAWRRALAGLVSRSIPPDELLPLLAAAYRELLAGQPRGSRVPLVELRDELARRREQTRAQFSWDVARLRRERRLIHDGQRIDLGVATGAAPSRRSSVVWIEDDSGAGLFYQSFRLVPAAPAGAKPQENRR
jgi:hypothetical protein